MIVKLTEYEVSYLTKNDIFIGKKRFNLIQFEGGNGCNKSCVQDFYFFFFLSSFILSLSTLFPPYFHYLVFKDRNDIETKIFTSITNAPIMIQTAITVFFFFLLSSFFFSFVSKESFHQPIRRSRDPSIRTTLTTLIDARRSCSPLIDRRNEDTTPRWLVYPRCRRWNRFSQKEHGEEQQEEENHWEILLLEWNVHPKK